MNSIMISTKILCFVAILAYIADATTTATSSRREFQRPPEKENSSTRETVDGIEAFDENDDLVKATSTLTIDNVRRMLENKDGSVGDAEVDLVHRKLLSADSAHSQRAVLSEYLLNRNQDGGTQVKRANTKTLLQNIQLFQDQQDGMEDNRDAPHKTKKASSSSILQDLVRAFDGDKAAATSRSRRDSNDAPLRSSLPRTSRQNRNGSGGRQKVPCRCEYPGENIYGSSGGGNKASSSSSSNPTLNDFGEFTRYKMDRDSPPKTLDSSPLEVLTRNNRGRAYAPENSDTSTSSALDSFQVFEIVDEDNDSVRKSSTRKYFNGRRLGDPKMVDVMFPTSRNLASQGHVDATNLLEVNGEYILSQSCWSCDNVQYRCPGEPIDCPLWDMQCSLPSYMDEGGRNGGAGKKDGGGGFDYYGGRKGHGGKKGYGGKKGGGKKRRGLLSDVESGVRPDDVSRDSGRSRRILTPRSLRRLTDRSENGRIMSIVDPRLKADGSDSSSDRALFNLVHGTRPSNTRDGDADFANARFFHASHPRDQGNTAVTVSDNLNSVLARMRSPNQRAGVDEDEDEDARGSNGGNKCNGGCGKTFDSCRIVMLPASHERCQGALDCMPTIPGMPRPPGCSPTPPPRAMPSPTRSPIPQTPWPLFTRVPEPGDSSTPPPNILNPALQPTLPPFMVPTPVRTRSPFLFPFQKPNDDIEPTGSPTESPAPSPSPSETPSASSGPVAPSLAPVSRFSCVSDSLSLCCAMFQPVI